MKITKRMLKQIIKEELKNAIEEVRLYDPSDPNAENYNQVLGREVQKFKDRNPVRAPEDVAFDADSFDKDEEKAAEKAAYLSARGDDEAGARVKPKARNPQLAATMQKLVRRRETLNQQIQQLQDMIDRS